MAATSLRTNLRRYEARHPRLAPSIAPLSPDPEANILPYVAAEFVAQGRSMRLRGKRLQTFVDEKVAEARATIRGRNVREK